MLSGEVEFDDAYIGATKIGSKRGRGTSKAPFVVATGYGVPWVARLLAAMALTSVVVTRYSPIPDTARCLAP